MIENLDVWVLISLAFFSMLAGFMDAVVGGGGLIQLPALLLNLSELPIPRLLGTNKIAAFMGTSISAYQYSKRVSYQWMVLLIISVVAGVSSFGGAQLINHLNPSAVRPIIIIVLIGILIYTIIKKDLGKLPTKYLTIQKKIFYGSIIGIIVGFYDGFIGPGTGSFLVMGFVVILGMDFLHASAYSKIINCFTNLFALVVFILKGNFILPIALLMGGFNIVGNYIGAKIALKRGNEFIRWVFIVVVIILLIKLILDN